MGRRNNKMFLMGYLFMKTINGTKKIREVGFMSTNETVAKPAIKEKIGFLFR